MNVPALPACVSQWSRPAVGTGDMEPGRAPPGEYSAAASSVHAVAGGGALAPPLVDLFQHYPDEGLGRRCKAGAAKLDDADVAKHPRQGDRHRLEQRLAQ